jgi:hypothetical protein
MRSHVRGGASSCEVRLTLPKGGLSFLVGMEVRESAWEEPEQEKRDEANGGLSTRLHVGEKRRHWPWPLSRSGTTSVSVSAASAYE